MIREDRRHDMCVSLRHAVRMLSACAVISGAARFFDALRSFFFVFWFTQTPIRENRIS